MVLNCFISMLFYRRMDNLVLEERLLGSEAEEQPNLKRRIWVESKLIWKIALPSMLARVTSFGMIVVTQAFLGHIDELELAAFALVQSLVLRFVNGILVCYYYLLRFLKAKLYFYLQILRIVSFDFLGLVGTMFIYSLSFPYLQLQELVITQKQKKTFQNSYLSNSYFERRKPHKDTNCTLLFCLLE